MLNRCLLNLRAAEVLGLVPPHSGRASPFGLRSINSRQHNAHTHNGVQVVDLDDMTLCWDPELQAATEGDESSMGGGHRASESVGSSAKLLRLELEERRRGSAESDWFRKE